MQTSKNTILITGGATGIGLALAKQFAVQDNTVIICGRRKNRLEEAKAMIPGLIIRVCDVSIEDERVRLYEWSVKNFPAINVLINNAGIQQSYNLQKTIDISLVSKEVETNFIAPVHLSNLFSDHLKKQTEAAIINISSGLAFTPLAFMSVYCATKAALHSFSLSLRHQLSGTPIKVFEILPPMVDTELDGGDRDHRETRDRGMNADEFARQAIESIHNDEYEAAIGTAANLRSKREEAFGFLNH